MWVRIDHTHSAPEVSDHWPMVVRISLHSTAPGRALHLVPPFKLSTKHLEGDNVSAYIDGLYRKHSGVSLAEKAERVCKLS